MIKIEELLVGQNYLRRTDYIEDMIRHVRGGGHFTQNVLDKWASDHESTNHRLIYITKFPDGVLFIHDGHHRIVSTFLGGRDMLREDEYTIKEWTYHAYLNVDFGNGFVTPFDVKAECRIADFCDWKKKIIAMASEGSAELAMDTIVAESNMYSEPRINRTVRQLACEYQRMHKPAPKKVTIRASGVHRTAEGFETNQEAANALNLQKAKQAVKKDRGNILDDRKIEIATAIFSDMLRGDDAISKTKGKPRKNLVEKLREDGAEIVKKSREKKPKPKQKPTRDDPKLT